MSSFELQEILADAPIFEEIEYSGGGEEGTSFELSKWHVIPKIERRKKSFATL
jgi:hypothetical protein